ncbi:MAG: ATP-binding protein [Symploca sp. SIO2E9]|nr:ATP-binding protein [Symploca sp. SIO2E9]
MLQVQLPGLGLKAPVIKRWQPVIKRWQRVIELELEEQQKKSQGELLNPFQYGNPVRLNQNYLFKGRQAFADDIVRLILNRNRPTLVLYGPRRCGKTSFLYNLPRLFPSDLLPVFLDMQSAAATKDEAAFCYSLVRAIYKDSRSQGVQLPTIPKRNEFQESPYTTLEDWLDEALPQLEDRQLLLNLDEFEKIGTAIKEGQMSLKLFDELRHLIQHYEQLGFLFSGVSTLEEIGPHWSSYFISVVPIEMLYLEPNEAKDLLLNPDPEFILRYDRGIVEEVLRLTRSQPYLLQLLGAAMVTQANLNHTQILTSELLQAAIQDAFTLGEPYFTNVWTEFTGKSPSEIAVGQKLLLALAQSKQPDSDRDKITQTVLQRMLRYHIIEQKDKEYRFEVPLLEMWVRERANSSYVLL